VHHRTDHSIQARTVPASGQHTNAHRKTSQSEISSIKKIILQALYSASEPRHTALGGIGGNFDDCSYGIVSTSQKEVVVVKSTYALVAVLLLSLLPLASAQQAPPANSTPAPLSTTQVWSGTPQQAPAIPSVAPVPAQKPAPKVAHEANFDAERAQANQLYLAGRRLEALPLYEDLCRQDEANPAFAERHGIGLIGKAGTLSDPKQQTEMYAQGMKELDRARSLGDDSPAVVNVLSMYSRTPFGVVSTGSMGALPLTVGYFYQGTAEAQALIKQGEAVFNAQKFDEAAKFYTAAAAKDPKFYMAALYSGDAYYRVKDYTNAGIWYAKAIAIDPDRETAYRYWGDELLMAGDSNGARVKFELAMAAEPYTLSTMSGLKQWGVQTHIALLNPVMHRPYLPRANGKITNADQFAETGDGRSCWLVYAQSRMAHDPNVIFDEWVMAGSVPNTPELNFVPNGYIHTLAEEVDAINALLDDLKKKLDAGTVTEEKLLPEMKAMLQMQKDHMLEPFILLNFNDAGLRHGYPEYRAAHRDQVVAYIDRYLIDHSGTPVTQHPNWVPIQP
jgi:tetratricopeptide (TPR) repeat protein